MVNFNISRHEIKDIFAILGKILSIQRGFKICQLRYSILEITSTSITMPLLAIPAYTEHAPK
jgi:hypothetical protein